MDNEFVRLLIAHRSMLHSFVYAVARDAHQTEDILQETGVVLWSKFSEYQPGTDFGAWARGVAYREILAARRTESRARRVLDERVARQILAAYERRSETVDAASHRQALGECLEGLREELRDVMRRRYALRNSSREIGEAVSRSAQAVDALVYRVKKALAECVRSKVAGEEA